MKILKKMFRAPDQPPSRGDLNLQVRNLTEGAELIAKLHYMSHQKFGSKMKSAMTSPNTGFQNFWLKQNSSSGYEYSYSEVKNIKYY